jgi:hypothetical protein
MPSTPPRNWWQFSLLTLFKITLISSAGAYLLAQMLDTSAFVVGLFVILMLLQLPFVLLPEIIDWVFGVDRNGKNDT